MIEPLFKVSFIQSILSYPKKMEEGGESNYLLHHKKYNLCNPHSNYKFPLLAILIQVSFVILYVHALYNLPCL